MDITIPIRTVEMRVRPCWADEGPEGWQASWIIVTRPYDGSIAYKGRVALTPEAAEANARTWLKSHASEYVEQES